MKQQTGASKEHQMPNSNQYVPSTKNDATIKKTKQENTKQHHNSTHQTISTKSRTTPQLNTPNNKHQTPSNTTIQHTKQ